MKSERRPLLQQISREQGRLTVRNQDSRRALRDLQRKSASQDRAPR